MQHMVAAVAGGATKSSMSKGDVVPSWGYGGAGYGYNSYGGGYGQREDVVYNGTNLRIVFALCSVFGLLS